MQTTTIDAPGKGRMDYVKGRFTWMLVAKISLVLSYVFLLFIIMKQADLSAQIDQGSETAARDFEQSMGLLIVAGFLLFIAAVLNIVMTCLWTSKVGLNLHLAEMPDLKFTPGWYVGWYFIPVAWWFMPFMTLKEIGKASASLNNDRENWEQKPVSPMLLTWYILFAGYWAYTIVNWFITKQPEPTGNPILAYAKEVPHAVVPTMIGIGLMIILMTPSLIFASQVTKQQDSYKNS